MRHSTLLVGRVSLLVLLMFAVSPSASSQNTPKKPSIWQQMKDAAKQANQQGQQPSQPQQPGQRPGQRPSKPGQPSQGKGAAFNDSGPFKPPAGTKIEETVLAPLQQGGTFEVSPHGVHVAMVGTDGSRAVVYYDGLEGPKFDEILAQENHRVAFSPDGTRYAYCARAGNQYVVMVDGKELVRSTESQGGQCSPQTSHLDFTSNSKHVYYYADMHVTTPSDRTFRRFVFDGKPEIPNAEQAGVAFSPDGDHYAYIWNDINREKPWMLIVDGKPAAYQGGAPVWTNDSKHLYTERRAAGTNGTDLLFDGKPVARAFSFKVYVAPVGNTVVVAVTGGTNFHPLSFLVVNGKKVAGSETVERGSIDNVVFSPDGKHYAALCGDINSHHYVIVDGKRGQEYVSIEKLGFTADSSTVVYTSFVNGKTFVVVGDQEFGAPMGGGGSPVIAPAGNRVASFITINGSPSLLIDSKVVPLNARGGSDLSFSPDGLHYAYFSIDSGNGHRLVIDGVPQPQSVLSGDYIDLENTAGALKYIFSADSKHVAHFANSTSATARGIFLDGKFVPASLEGTNTKLAFSPDGAHLFWIHMYGDQPHRLFVDGKPLVDFYTTGNPVPHWWEFMPDGKLSFLAQDDNSLKRITITLSPETSLATMLGGEALASAH